MPRSSRPSPTTSEGTVTVGESLAAARLRLAGLPGAAFDAALLLTTALGTNTAWLLAHDGDAVGPEVLEGYRAAVERRAAGEPVPYITGMAGFYGRTFAVTADVLVPRPESERLVALALTRVARLEQPRICDVGTGSGILAVTLALEVPAAAVTAIDISAAALAVAKRNADAFGVSNRIVFRSGSAFEVPEPARRFDAVIANLPYVRSAHVAGLPDPTAYEPRVALDGGRDGLEVYRRFLRRAPRLLATQATLLMEAGPDTAQDLAHLAALAFGKAAITVHRDLSDRDRIVEVALGADAGFSTPAAHRR